MADRHLHFAGTTPGRFLTRRLGLPQPAALRRRSPETPSLDGSLLHLTAGNSRHTEALARLLPEILPTGTEPPAAIVLDATGVTTPTEGLPLTPSRRPAAQR